MNYLSKLYFRRLFVTFRGPHLVLTGKNAACGFTLDVSWFFCDFSVAFRGPRFEQSLRILAQRSLLSISGGTTCAFARIACSTLLVSSTI